MASDLTAGVLNEVLNERARQEEKWGEQNHIDGTDVERFGPTATGQKAQVDAAARRGTLTYLQILLEEVYEAAAEVDPGKLRAELVQVAAVAVAWVECIDRRTKA